MKVRFNRAAFKGLAMTTELLVVLIVILILATMGIFAYQKLTEKAKVSAFIDMLQGLETAFVAFYNDTGVYPGYPNSNVPFVIQQTSTGEWDNSQNPLLNRNAITNPRAQARWNGPYLQKEIRLPFDNMRLTTDYTTGKGTGLGQIYQYFIVVENVPFEFAVEISKELNGQERVDDCDINNINQVITGQMSPCKVYLETTNAGAGDLIRIYYAFAMGRL